VRERATIGFDVGEQSAQLGRLLRRHTAVQIEVDRLFDHGKPHRHRAALPRRARGNFGLS
jgi:hypothetical protein